MKKYLSLVLIAGLFVVSCAKKNESSSRISRAGTAGQGAPTQADVQAQQIGLNILWESTDVEETNDTVTSVTHTYSLNGQKQTATHQISSNVPNCSNRQALTYDVVNPIQVNGAYAVVGFTPCISGSDYILGAVFMAYSASSSRLVQEFVYMNLTTKGEALAVQKIITTQSQPTFLPDWMTE